MSTILERIDQYLNEDHVVFATSSPQEIVMTYVKKYGKDAISHLKNLIHMFEKVIEKSSDQSIKTINRKRLQNTQAALNMILARVK